LYDLKAIATPTAFFYGQQDPLADPIDAQRTIRTMNPSFIVANDNSQNFAHMDFSWGILPCKTIYPKYIDLIRRFAPKSQA